MMCLEGRLKQLLSLRAPQIFIIDFCYSQLALASAVPSRIVNIISHFICDSVVIFCISLSAIFDIF